MRLFEIFSETYTSTVGKNVMNSDEMLDYVEGLHSKPDDFLEGSDGGDLAQRIRRYPFYKLTELPMSNVDPEEWETDESMIDEYAARIAKSRTYPPIVFDAKAASIIDGTHRVAALHKLGAKSVWAYVGTRTRPKG